MSGSHEYRVVIEAGEDGYSVAHVPALKGCWSQGKTHEEALQNIREAISLHVEVLRGRGHDPEPSSDGFPEG